MRIVFALDLWVDTGLNTLFWHSLKFFNNNGGKPIVSDKLIVFSCIFNNLTIRLISTRILSPRLYA